MGRWLDDYKMTGKSGQVDEDLWGEIILELPNLVEAFTGSLDKEGKWLIGPSTLMIFIEQGKLKFCLSPKYTAKVCFGCVEDLEQPFLSVEKALADGRCEWKARGKKG